MSQWPTLETDIGINLRFVKIKCLFVSFVLKLYPYIIIILIESICAIQHVWNTRWGNYTNDESKSYMNSQLNSYWRYLISCKDLYNWSCYNFSANNFTMSCPTRPQVRLWNVARRLERRTEGILHKRLKSTEYMHERYCMCAW